MRSAEEHWRQVAQKQDGVLSRRQARQAGMSEDAWQWLLDTERVRRLAAGVVVVHTGTPTARQQCWAALHSIGEGASLTGDAALELAGFDGGRRAGGLQVAVAPPRRIASKRWVEGEPRRFIAVRHVSAAEAADVTRVAGVPCLPPALALVHAFDDAPSARAAEWRVAAAVQQRVVTADAVSRAASVVAELSRRALLDEVLLEVRRGAHAASELAFLRLLDRHHLPRPDRLQQPVRPDGRRYLDAWWSRRRTAVELDGGHHMEAAQWDADVLRANAVAVAGRREGVLLLRFTTGNLRHDEQQVAQQLRSALT